MLYGICLYKKDTHFQLKIKIRKARYDGRRRKSDRERERRDRRGKEASQAKNKWDIYYVSIL